MRGAADSKRTIQITVFDSSDGVRSNATTSGYSPRVAKSTDGKIWFLPFDGVSVIDPRHLPVNKLPPPVHIEQITADRKTYGMHPTGWRLPALTRDLEIDYTALSLVAPEKNRFKYKLEGRDPDWKDVGNERQGVLYRSSSTQLPLPRHGLRITAGCGTKPATRSIFPSPRRTIRRRGSGVVRSGLSGVGLGVVPVPAASSRAGVQRAAGREGRRARPHRAGTS